jgi:glycine/D-amino acid oxidase-like deaminating enzyme
MVLKPRVAVVGAGIFGVAAAIELRARGHEVVLCDPGPLPHPLAASTDVSKVVRIEYGDDAYYMALGERALDGWHRWNHDLDDTLYHETGVLFMARRPMTRGSFEHDSFAQLLERAHRPERLDASALARRFGAWSTGNHVDGFFHARGGFVESACVLTRLIERAIAHGVSLRQGASFAALKVHGDRVTGVHLRDGAVLDADHVVLALGAWTPSGLPELAGMLRATAHPVFHLRPREPARFVAAQFPVFGAAIAETGWYGFPLHPRDGIVKIARHSVGRAMHPEAPERAVTVDDVRALRGFLAETFPALTEAELVATRACLYCDTHDGHFLIDRDPTRRGLTVATGDSGHGFKFAPVLGALIADVVAGANAEARFRWRAREHTGRSHEAARHGAH